MDEDQASESESLSGSGNALPEHAAKHSFNAGEYTGNQVTIDTRTSSSEPVYPPIRRRRPSRTKKVFLTMAMVGLFVVAVLAGVAVLWGINVGTASLEPHGFEKRNLTSTTPKSRENSKRHGNA